METENINRITDSCSAVRTDTPPGGRERVAVAMSGGVDSAVAALLLRRQGFDCFGVTMKLCRSEDEKRAVQSEHDISDARAVSAGIGIEHQTWDLSEEFEKTVVADFISAYESGETPAPCILCNRKIKFGLLLDRALDAGADRLATGHYARIVRSGDRYLLYRAADPVKDQSYMLYSLGQSRLSRILFPLGGLSKDEVREIASEAGLAVSHKSDSQDICFVPDGRYTEFISSRTGRTYPPGDFVAPSGDVIGKHRGIIGYTVGQRRGLGLSLPEPLYVRRISPTENRIYLSPDSGLYSRELDADSVSFIPFDSLSDELRVKAKIRYRHTEQWATVRPTGEDTVHVIFDEPQRAITPGQAVVFYDGDCVVGGGRIR